MTETVQRLLRDGQPLALRSVAPGAFERCGVRRRLIALPASWLLLCAALAAEK